MSASADLQNHCVRLLTPALPPEVRVLHRRPKEPANDFEVALADQTICVYILPPFALSALQGSPALFFDKYEVRCRVLEQPALNDTGLDAWDVAERIALTLHWQMIPGMLAHPLYIAPRPMEMVEDPQRRAIDVIFYAQIELTN